MIWLYIATALNAGIAIGAWVGLVMLARRVAAYAAASSESTGQLPRSIVSKIDALTERVDELQPAVEGLLNREKMRRVRQGAKLDGGEPDPHTQPVEWKAYMRRRSALGGGR